MPTKPKKTKEERTAESYFPIDTTDLKYTTEKIEKAPPKREEILKGSIEKKYKKPERILKIWLINQKQAKQKSIAKKYAALVHIGGKRAMKEFPIIKKIIKSNSEIQNELKLNEEEKEFIFKY